ncbi:MAG: TIR domain-containing protein [Anaerolineales bacterium]
MDKPTFDRLVQAILPEMDDPNARKALVESALYGSPVLEKIEWNGAARPFTVRLVRQLDEFGEIALGKPALVALLEEIKASVGENRQAQLDGLIAALGAPSPAQQDITPPDETLDDELYIFLSYARPEAPIADQVERYLTAAGVRVFRDVTNIGEGDNWDMTIEQALNECGHMVLLLSASSMPYRKEVHREWFFFDQKRKPIYPLYVQECELHSRLYAYNYIDARDDLQKALDRLLAELKRDYVPPDAASGADKIGVFADAPVEERSLPESLQALLDAVRDPEGDVVLSVEQATDIRDHKPADLTEYRLGRIAEWSLPRYQLDNRFVNLTLMLDKGEDAQQRWERAADFRFNDLRDVLAEVDDAALVLLGAPGSGKSTLLRRLQLDHSIDALRDDSPAVSFFIQLNGYRAPSPDNPLPAPRA